MALFKLKKLHTLFATRLHQILDHAGFDEAMTMISRRTIENAERDGALTKITGDLSNVLLELLSIYFHAERELAGKGRGATIGALQLASFLHSLKSPRSVSAAVDILVQSGRIARIGDAKDRRIVRLIATEQSIRSNREHMLVMSDAVRIMNPLCRASLVLRAGDNEDFYRMALQLGRLYTSGADPMTGRRELLALLSRDAGYPIVHSLVDACIEQHGRIASDLEFQASSTAIASRFGISRAHVRNLIAVAEKQKLLNASSGRSSAISFSAEMIDNWRAMIGCKLLVSDEASRIAFGEGETANLS